MVYTYSTSESTMQEKMRDESAPLCGDEILLAQCWMLAHRLIGDSPMLRLFFGIDYGKRRMGAVAVRWMIAVVFLGTFAKAPARARSGVQKFQIRVPDPAYSGLPIWI